MKQFFYTAFGGIAAVLFGVIVAYAIATAWRMFKPIHAIPFSSTILEDTQTASPTLSDHTSISGLKRTIQYTASEEEGFIDAALSTLPVGSIGHVTALGYVAKNLSTGASSVNHEADRLFPIASITKLITAVVARKLISPDTRITLSKNIMATYGNTAGFKIGETFTADDLLFPLLMVSSNDAAEGYAEAYGRKGFIQAMNKFTQSIGAYRTYFDDPSGLSANNVSTPNDLALILNWIRIHDPEIIQITQLKSKTIRSHTWVNPTHFLSWSYYSGGKNGYTEEANRTAAQLFTLGKNKDTYALIILGSSNRDGDMLQLLKKVENQNSKK